MPSRSLLIGGAMMALQGGRVPLGPPATLAPGPYAGRVLRLLLIVLTLLCLQACDAVRDVQSGLSAQHRASVAFLPASGTVLESAVLRVGVGASAYEPRVRYRYTVSGVTHESERYAYWYVSSRRRQQAEAIVERYPVGAQITVYYDPLSPGRSVLYPHFDRPSGLGLVMMGAGLLFLPAGALLLYGIQRRRASRGSG